MSAETTIRGAFATRTSSELLTDWEVLDCSRDDAARADDSLGYQAAADLIGYLIDELDKRYPHVVGHWSDLSALGQEIDLAAMFRIELT